MESLTANILYNLPVVQDLAEQLALSNNELWKIPKRSMFKKADRWRTIYDAMLKMKDALVYQQTTATSVECKKIMEALTTVFDLNVKLIQSRVKDQPEEVVVVAKKAPEPPAKEVIVVETIPEQPTLMDMDQDATRIAEAWQKVAAGGKRKERKSYADKAKEPMRAKSLPAEKKPVEKKEAKSVKPKASSVGGNPHPKPKASPRPLYPYDLQIQPVGTATGSETFTKEFGLSAEETVDVAAQELGRTKEGVLHKAGSGCTVCDTVRVRCRYWTGKNRSRSVPADDDISQWVPRLSKGQMRMTLALHLYPGSGALSFEDFMEQGVWRRDGRVTITTVLYTCDGRDVTALNVLGTKFQELQYNPQGEIAYAPSYRLDYQGTIAYTRPMRWDDEV